MATLPASRHQHTSDRRQETRDCEGWFPRCIRWTAWLPLPVYQQPPEPLYGVDADGGRCPKYITGMRMTRCQPLVVSGADAGDWRGCEWSKPFSIITSVILSRLILKNSLASSTDGIAVSNWVENSKMARMSSV